MILWLLCFSQSSRHHIWVCKCWLLMTAVEFPYGSQFIICQVYIPCSEHVFWNLPGLRIAPACVLVPICVSPIITNTWDNHLLDQRFLLAHRFRGFSLAGSIAPGGRTWQSKTARLKVVKQKTEKKRLESHNPFQDLNLNGLKPHLLKVPPLPAHPSLGSRPPNTWAFLQGDIYDSDYGTISAMWRLLYFFDSSLCPRQDVIVSKHLNLLERQEGWMDNNTLYSHRKLYTFQHHLNTDYLILTSE